MDAQGQAIGRAVAADRGVELGAFRLARP